MSWASSCSVPGRAATIDRTAMLISLLSCKKDISAPWKHTTASSLKSYIRPRSRHSIIGKATETMLQGFGASPRYCLIGTVPLNG